MTNGDPGGTGRARRWPPWAVAYAIIFLATLLIGTVNVLSQLDERSWMNRPLEWWRPAVWEATSALVMLSLAWIPLLMIRHFPPARPHPIPNLARHLLVTVPFSLVHVGLMVALRHAAYALAGERYSFGGGWAAVAYEYRKDIISYALYAAVFWLVPRAMRAARLDQADAAPAALLVSIDDGKRVIRVPASGILCIRSRGNYAEFVLADGRRPLVRATLGSLEGRLAEAGLVRTHRSWLVNADHVVEISGEGSGDHALRLTDGSRVPLSRRYAGALARLRS